MVLNYFTSALHPAPPDQPLHHDLLVLGEGEPVHHGDHHVGQGVDSKLSP